MPSALLNLSANEKPVKIMTKWIAGPGEPHCAVAHHDAAYHDPHIHPGEPAFGPGRTRAGPVCVRQYIADISM